MSVRIWILLSTHIYRQREHTKYKKKTNFDVENSAQTFEHIYLYVINAFRSNDMKLLIVYWFIWHHSANLLHIILKCFNDRTDDAFNILLNLIFDRKCLMLSLSLYIYILFATNVIRKENLKSKFCSSFPQLSHIP